jgi:hypothetical protein
MKKLSIIIVSYNTKELLADCLSSLNKVKDEVSFETIVSDNGSLDGSLQMVRENFPGVSLIENNRNLGFAKGNNAARSYVNGEIVLFLNSDVVIRKNTLRKTVKYLDDNKDVGAVTCKIVLPDGSLDKDARRSFPTPWVSLTHFSGLDRLFSKSYLFSKYWYGYRKPDATHEVDVLQGAFFMVRREILNDVGWFDESYFLDGEDIDLSWKIKNAGWKIMYYPKVSIIHVKKGSKLKARSLKNIMAGVDSMEIFYKKRLWNKYPAILNFCVLIGIKAIKLARLTKALTL